MTCTYVFSHFRHFQNCCNRDGNKIFKYMNYVPIVVATDLEVHFSVLKKGVSQYFCLYSVCTSHWCLVMSFWLKVCIYSHTRGVKLGLGLGFMQTSQVLPHWLNQSFSFWTLSYTQRHCHDRIEKGPVQTVAIILEAHNFLEYHYDLTLRFVLIEITKVVNLFIRRGRPNTFGNIVYMRPHVRTTTHTAINILEFSVHLCNVTPDSR